MFFILAIRCQCFSSLTSVKNLSTWPSKCHPRNARSTFAQHEPFLLSQDFENMLVQWFWSLKVANCYWICQWEGGTFLKVLPIKKWRCFCIWQTHPHRLVSHSGSRPHRRWQCPHCQGLVHVLTGAGNTRILKDRNAHWAFLNLKAMKARFSKQLKLLTRVNWNNLFSNSVWYVGAYEQTTSNYRCYISRFMSDTKVSLSTPISIKICG